MFSHPRFLSRPVKTGLSVHNTPSENIQGGAPAVLNPDGTVAVADQHYHISAPLYQYIIDLAHNNSYAEPVMSKLGIIVTSLRGDIAMAFVRYGAVSVPDAVVISGGSDLPIGVNDPFWSYVICLTDLAGPAGTYTSVDQSPYNNLPNFAGSDSFDSADFPLFTKNTIKASAPGAFMSLACTLDGDFTFEAHGRFTAIAPLMEVGNSLLNATARFTSFSTGVLTTSSGLSTPFSAFTYSPTQYYHLCMERKGTIIKFFIDGEVLASVNTGGGPIPVYSGVNLYASYYANLRVTKAKARYNLTNFAPPTGPYLTN